MKEFMAQKGKFSSADRMQPVLKVVGGEFSSFDRCSSENYDLMIMLPPCLDEDIEHRS